VAETTSPSPRARAAWRAWLSALAVDAEAALAAALTYESLDAVARDAFLDAIDEDADAIDVPKIAIYAPFLAVENDPLRKERLEKTLGSANEHAHDPHASRRALSGRIGEEQLTVLVLPLYLGFVEVLACRWSHERGCVSAEHEPLRAAREFQRAKIWDGVELEDTPFDAAIEELAHAVVTTTRRQGRTFDALVPFADLFSLRSAGAPL
jgi:hypothetical protein